MALPMASRPSCSCRSALWRSRRSCGRSSAASLASNSCPPLASSGAAWSRTQSMAKLSKLNHASRGHRLQLRAQQLMHTVHFPRNGAPGPIFRGCTACRAFGAPPRRRRPRRLIYYRAERVELKVNSRRIHLIPFAISSTVIFRIRHPTYPLLTAQYEYGVAPACRRHWT